MSARDEPRWPEGTIVKTVTDWATHGPYIVNADGVPCFANGMVAGLWHDPNPRWEVVCYPLPEGHTAVPDEVCEFMVGIVDSAISLARLPSEHLDRLRSVRATLDPPPPVEYVTVPTTDDDFYCPTEEDVLAQRGWTSAADSMTRALAHAFLTQVDAQLDEGKELRP